MSSRSPAFTLIIGFSTHPAEKITHKNEHAASYGRSFLQNQIKVFFCFVLFLCLISFPPWPVLKPQVCSYVCVCVFSFIRLYKSRGADHKASSLHSGKDVQDPPRFEQRQKPPQAAALRLHRQRWSSPGWRRTNTDCQPQNTQFLSQGGLRYAWQLQTTVTPQNSPAHLKETEYLAQIVTYYFLLCVLFRYPV